VNELTLITPFATTIEMILAHFVEFIFFPSIFFDILSAAAVVATWSLGTSHLLAVMTEATVRTVRTLSPPEILARLVTTVVVLLLLCTIFTNEEAVHG
jgi:hypothetical protein